MADTPDNPLAAAQQEAASRISEAWRREIHIDSADDLLAKATAAVNDLRARAQAAGWDVSSAERDAAWDTASRAISAYVALDALLSAGGPMPAAWADCAPVINVVSHIPDIVDLPDGNQVFAPPPRTVPLDAHVRKLAERDAEIAKLRALHGEAANLLGVAGAEISRLTAELDATRNVPVEYVITAGLEAAMAADPHREDGAILRTTDGKREAWAWKAATREWEQIQ